MRVAIIAILIGMAVVLCMGCVQSEPTCATAWFTDASVDGAVKGAKPTDALPNAPGTAGNGVALSHAVAIENPVLQQKCGVIGFWIKPNWDGNDGKTHRILRIGDLDRNGFLLEKAANGMLRYVMTSSKKTTASRADVSGWKKGEWHHVVIVWMSLKDVPIGLPLWIDKVAVDGPIAGVKEFPNPDTMSDKRLWIGDETSDSVIDELIMRNVIVEPGLNFGIRDIQKQTAVVYRDYFRTAPYTDIQVNHEALFVPSDRRVVNGHEKQFGLMGKLGDGWEPMTDYTVRYRQWGDFDAKPFIKWTTSDPAIAAVDKNGRVTGKSVGKCKLTAEYRGMQDSYDIEVIPLEQPDLDLIYVEMLPRYSRDEFKDRHAPGDCVTSVVHILNFGYETASAGAVVRLELIPDANENFRCDPNEKPVAVMEKTINIPMTPRDGQNVKFQWTFPAEPTWIRVTVDPGNKIPEICEANNQTCELSNARPIRFAFTIADRDAEYSDKKINHVGSFSMYDWMNAEKLRMDKMIRETVIPETSPVGIQDSYRTDMYYDLLLCGDETEPYHVNDKYFDGGFPINEPIDLMSIDSAIIHEFGHCVLSEPDLYGYPVYASSVLLKDENGQYYAGGELFPVISEGFSIGPLSSANVTPCGAGYTSLMDLCHLWLHPSTAGHVQWFRGFRGPRFWGSQGRLVPLYENWLRILDINDRPLVGAAVYVYQCTQTGAMDNGTQFFADRPKFIGNTDKDGLFRFPDRCDEDWDDPDTSVVDKGWPVWNPFGRAGTSGMLDDAEPADAGMTDIAATPGCWGTDGLLLLKIVSGNQTEFAWFTLDECNQAFYRGERNRGMYPIRTSLQPSSTETPIARNPIPDAIKKANYAPLAIIDKPMEFTVKYGEELRIDGSKSSDPEGQPLVYRWYVRGGDDPIAIKTFKDIKRFSDQPIYQCAMPKEPGEGIEDPVELEIVFYVIDGLRVSETLFMRVRVVEPE